MKKEGVLKMEKHQPNILVKIRSNYNLLLFLVIPLIPLVLWWLLMLLVAFSGTLFDDPSQIGMNIFMVFFFPLIVAPIISGLAMLITRLISIPGIGCLIIVGLGFIIPLVAFVLVFLGSLITRKLYIGDLEKIPDLMPKKTNKNDIEAPKEVNDESVEQLSKLKDLLDKGLITSQDFETKKDEILSKM